MYQSYREAIGDNKIVSDTGADGKIVWHCSCFPKTVLHIKCKMMMMKATINLYMSKGKSTAHPHSQSKVILLTTYWVDNTILQHSLI